MANKFHRQADKSRPAPTQGGQVYPGANAGDAAPSKPRREAGTPTASPNHGDTAPPKPRRQAGAPTAPLNPGQTAPAAPLRDRSKK